MFSLKVLALEDFPLMTKGFSTSETMFEKSTPPKAFKPIEVTLLGIVIDDKLQQFSKAR